MQQLQTFIDEELWEDNPPPVLVTTMKRNTDVVLIIKKGSMERKVHVTIPGVTDIRFVDNETLDSSWVPWLEILEDDQKQLRRDIYAVFPSGKQYYDFLIEYVETLIDSEPGYSSTLDSLYVHKSNRRSILILLRIGSRLVRIDYLLPVPMSVKNGADSMKLSSKLFPEKEQDSILGAEGPWSKDMLEKDTLQEEGFLPWENEIRRIEESIEAGDPNPTKHKLRVQLCQFWKEARENILYALSESDTKVSKSSSRSSGSSEPRFLTRSTQRSTHRKRRKTVSEPLPHKHRRFSSHRRFTSHRRFSSLSSGRKPWVRHPQKKSNLDPKSPSGSEIGDRVSKP